MSDDLRFGPIVFYRLGDRTLICPVCEQPVRIPAHEFEEPGDDDAIPAPQPPPFGTLESVTCPACHTVIQVEEEPSEDS